MKRSTTTILILTLLAATGLARAQSAGMKIGVFDANRVSEESDEGKRIAARLTALGDKKKGEITAKEKEISDLRQQLESQTLSLSPEKQNQLQKDIQKKGLELQQAQESARNEFQIEVSEAQNKFQEQLLRVINQFGRDEGFTLVLERATGGVAFAAESIDVTTAIVDKFNQMVKPPADAAAKPAAPTPAPKPKP
ncbi:MAG TPA: OmpH family outer membrane protein [Candidatus Bathyarchaeia archaeon]|jgi:outer membrane protein|nr:OmpH family outer membrane protein [Candidatus Bathyarchaeia archaeon]